MSSWIWSISRLSLICVTFAVGLGCMALIFGRALPSQGQIAYLSRQGVRSEIHILDVGRTITHVLDTQFNVEQPTWSDELIAFIWGYHGLAVMDTNARNLQLITHGSQTTAPAWSRDGQWLAFGSSQDGDGEIYVVGADGSHLRQLTNNWVYDGAPSWSPDGSQIVFRSTRSGYSDLYIMDSDGNNVRQLTDTDAWDESPTWSPDGRYIAYAAFGRSWDIYVFDLASGESRQLTQHTARDSRPVWSPDSRYLAFESNRNGYLDLYMIDITLSDPEQNIRRLTDDFYDSSYPMWQ